MTNLGDDSSIRNLRERRLAILMKMLEIIEKDDITNTGMSADESISQIRNVIHRGTGNIFVSGREITMEGDKFGDISHSIVATRGSIAEGIISVRERHGEPVADAIRQVEAAIASSETHGLSREERNEALELLAEITKQGGSSAASRPVLKAIGSSLWTIITKAPTLVSACLEAWKVIEKLWG